MEQSGLSDVIVQIEFAPTAEEQDSCSGMSPKSDKPKFLTELARRIPKSDKFIEENPLSFPDFSKIKKCAVAL